MNIVLTGASGQVGRALLEILSGPGYRTVALVRRPAELSATRTLLAPPGTVQFASAIEQADVVAHLAGALRPGRGDSYRSANVEAALAVARALGASRARRVLFLSYVGASEISTNPYLRTKAAAERALAESGREVVVFRCTHIIGPPWAPGPTARALLPRPGRRVIVLGSGRQRVAPVYRGDVAAALKAAIEGGPPGTYELAGPASMSMDDLVRLVNQDPQVPIAHMPRWAARALGLVARGLPAPLVDIMGRDSLGNAARAVRAFGLGLTSLRALWAEAAAPRLAAEYGRGR